VRAKPSRSQKGIAAGKLLLGTMANAPTEGEADIAKTSSAAGGTLTD
jgi:hypothetical protein